MNRDDVLFCLSSPVQLPPSVLHMCYLNLHFPPSPVTKGHADGEVSFDGECQSHEDGCVEGHRRQRVEDLSEQGVEGLKERNKGRKEGVEMSLTVSD